MSSPSNTYQYLNNFLKIIDSNKELILRTYESSEKIIIWLVGFSVGSIALTINSENENIKSISDLLYIFSALTIILGIIHRVALYFLYTYEVKMYVGLQAYVSSFNLENNDNSNVPLTEEAKNALKKYLGYPEKFFEKDNSRSIARSYWVSYRISKILFFLTCSTFIFGIIILTFSLLLY